jgi:hypothetical protein
MLTKPKERCGGLVFDMWSGHSNRVGVQKRPGNNSGFISIGMIVFLLALFGGWSMWHAYKEGTLASSLKSMAGDCSEALGGGGGSGYGRMNHSGGFSDMLDKAKEYVQKR